MNTTSNNKKGKRLFNFLGILQVFIALGAIPAGIGFITDPSGTNNCMSTDLLAASPFDDFLIPGLFLLIINGLGNSIASVFSFQRKKVADVLAMFFGFILILWIVLQVWWIGYATFLQPFYLIVGIIEFMAGLKIYKRSRLR